MQEETVKLRVHTIIKRLFPSIQEIKNENIGPNEINEWDSLAHLGLITEINKEFKISIDFEDVLSINKISDIYKILSKYKK